jgi:tetratricopeptide (TPR) repeat protein
MKLISHNPYRVAGILSNVTEKELQRQKSKIKRYSEVGKQITSDYDFSFLENIDRSEQSIESAFSSIEQSQDKVRNSLFWFLNANTFDNTALDYLKNGDLKKAREIWEKVTLGKAVTDKNYSSFNNISTLNLLSTRVEDIKEGVEGKIQLLESNSFKDFAHTIADETFTADSDKQIEYFIDDILNQFKTSNSQLDINILFSGVNGTAKKYISKQFTEEPIHNIESEIESTKSKRKANKSNAYEFGSRLFVNCEDDLAKLKKILGANDLRYKMLSDSLAEEVMQCGIDYFKEWKETKNPSEEGLRLLKFAKSIASSKKTKDRANDNIESLEEWSKNAPIQADLSYVTNQLKNFQDASDNINNALRLAENCKPKLTNMGSILGTDDEFYLNVSSAVASNSLGMLISVVNEAQESFGNQPQFMRTVEPLKRAIKEALRVTNIIDLLDMNDQTRNHFIQNRSSLRNLESQIFNATATSTEKAGRLAGQAAKVTARAGRASAKAAGTFAQEMRDKNKSEGGCYIATMAYGDYDHPQVIELRKFRDNYLSKFFLGRRFIKFYYKNSPTWVEKLNNKTTINRTIRYSLNILISIIKK